MGKLYQIGRGHLLDDSGKEHHKDAVIDIDNFKYLHDRVKSFVKNGILLIPGKIKKELSQIDIEKQDLDKAIKEFEKEKSEFKKEKKEFQKIKDDFYKEIEDFEVKQKASKKSGKKGD